MTKNQGYAIMALLAFIAVWTYASFCVAIPSVVRHDEQNMVTIECTLHRDNPDVHKFCVDQGYDR